MIKWLFAIGKNIWNCWIVRDTKICVDLLCWFYCGWTETWDVFKSKPPPGGAICYTSWTETWDVFKLTCNSRPSDTKKSWTETWDVFKYINQKHFFLLVYCWTETWDVFKLRRCWVVQNAFVVEPKHEMYLNKIESSKNKADYSGWTETWDVFKLHLLIQVNCLKRLLNRNMRCI